MAGPSPHVLHRSSCWLCEQLGRVEQQQARQLALRNAELEVSVRRLQHRLDAVLAPVLSPPPQLLHPSPQHQHQQQPQQQRFAYGDAGRRLNAAADANATTPPTAPHTSSSSLSRRYQPGGAVAEAVAALELLVQRRGRSYTPVRDVSAAVSLSETPPQQASLSVGDASGAAATPKSNSVSPVSEELSPAY